jgi:glyoxylase-like metal-dependent hydrolase (beta-lactamase superfamily II)
MTGRRLDELTTVVLAPNHSAMTLDGTNTYLIGASGSGEVVLVDPGPRLPAHRAAIDAALAVLDATVRPAGRCDRVSAPLTCRRATRVELARYPDARKGSASPLP